MSLPLLSVIIPCYNEEAVIRQTHTRLSRMANELKQITTELIFVDDGSRDETLPILRELAVADPRLRVLALSRNYGHQVATTAGIDAARGDAVVLIDADLQDPPELIPQMIELWQQGWHVVYGQRRQRSGESAFKLLTARLFYRLINSLSEVAIPSNTGDFRLMDRKVVEAIRAMPERHRFLRGMVAWTGFRQTALVFDRAARVAGQTKYPFLKMLRLALDGIVSFSSIPLKLATWLGFTAFFLSLFGISYTLFFRLFTEQWVQGWAFTVITIMFLGGVQLLTLGIMGEYLGRIYNEVKRRPLYFLSEEIGKTPQNAQKES